MMNQPPGTEYAAASGVKKNDARNNSCYFCFTTLKNYFKPLIELTYNSIRLFRHSSDMSFDFLWIISLTLSSFSNLFSLGENVLAQLTFKCI